MKPQLVIIGGPTATGKTALGVRLAQAIDGEIVSCDSMQIYRDMDIGTAKVTATEMGGVKHHLLDFVSPDVSYSVAQYQQDAHRVIDDILARNKVPIVVGGTGLYINAILYPMTFHPFSDEVRQQIRQQYLQYGNLAMYEKLLSLAPQMAEKLSPNDVKRVARCLELVELGAHHNTDDLQKQALYTYKMVVLSGDRAALYVRINQRVDSMMQQGLLQEVQSLLNSGVSVDSQSFQAIAYKELAQYIAGEMALDEAVELIKKRSRNYAKRQLTWFRQYKDALWLAYDNDNLPVVLEAYKNEQQSN